MRSEFVAGIVLGLLFGFLFGYAFFFAVQEQVKTEDITVSTVTAATSTLQSTSKHTTSLRSMDFYIEFVGIVSSGNRTLLNDYWRCPTLLKTGAYWNWDAVLSLDVSATKDSEGLWRTTEEKRTPVACFSQIFKREFVLEIVVPKWTAQDSFVEVMTPLRAKSDWTGGDLNDLLLERNMTYTITFAVPSVPTNESVLRFQGIDINVLSDLPVGTAIFTASDFQRFKDTGFGDPIFYNRGTLTRMWDAGSAIPSGHIGLTPGDYVLMFENDGNMKVYIEYQLVFYDTTVWSEEG